MVRNVNEIVQEIAPAELFWEKLPYLPDGRGPVALLGNVVAVVVPLVEVSSINHGLGGGCGGRRQRAEPCWPRSRVGVTRCCQV